MEIKAHTNYPGKVKGQIVRSVFNLSKYDTPILYVNNFLPDHILYVDKIKGLLIERHSILSHAAIVAREFKIPSAVGVTCDKLKEGTEIELMAYKNGVTIIKILNKNK